MFCASEKDGNHFYQCMAFVSASSLLPWNFIRLCQNILSKKEVQMQQNKNSEQSWTHLRIKRNRKPFKNLRKAKVKSPTSCQLLFPAAAWWWSKRFKSQSSQSIDLAVHYITCYVSSGSSTHDICSSTKSFYFDNLDITRIRAPFSSRRRWLSFFRCSSC